MTEPLRDLMERLAEDQPAVAVDPTLYTRGRRAHRRGTLLRAGAAVALVGVAALAAVPVLDPAERATAPAVGERAPAIPSELHPVPGRLAGSGEDGIRWHTDLRADDLAIGPTAAVFPVNGGAVMAVSAVDGSYRGLELPGFDESSYFRFEGVPVSLSPDGTRLAWTWNPDVISGPGNEEAATGVRIADLDTGEVTDIRIVSRYGVYAQGFGWSQDGTYLAYGVQVVTSPTGEVRGSRSFGVGRLDTSTGDAVVTGLRGTDSAPAVSNDGTVAVSGGGYNAIWSPDRSPEVRTYDGPFDSVAWSPDGRRTALSSTTRQLAVGDARGVRRETTWDDSEEGRLRVLGWDDDTSFVVLDEAASTLSRVSADLEETEVLVRGDGIQDLHQLSVATDLLDQPTRDTPAPDWPTDWESVAWRTALAVGALLAGIALMVSLRRRGG